MLRRRQPKEGLEAYSGQREWHSLAGSEVLGGLGDLELLSGGGCGWDRSRWEGRRQCYHGLQAGGLGLAAGLGVWSARGCITLPARLGGAWGCSVPRLSAKVHSPCTLCSEKLRDLGRHIIMVPVCMASMRKVPAIFPSTP